MLFECCVIVLFVSSVVGYVDHTAQPPLQCGINEIEVKCRTICPPQNCEIAYTDYDCTPYSNICERGCDCLPNYLRNGSGICIPSDSCPYPTSPTCGVNEIARDCRRTCPPQTCLSRVALFRCLPPEKQKCEPGCDCVANYLRNSDGVCIPADQCDASPTCSVPDRCIRTCEDPSPPNCPYTPAKTNKDGCECMEGYILFKHGGKCVRFDECQIDISCYGDPHAQPRACPPPCPSTCDSPDATPCKKACEPIGCACVDGYMFSNVTGKCVLPEECPGGNPCGDNEEFLSCKTNCPQDYCPKDDSRISFICNIESECRSGCACKLNYKRLSYEDNTCIVASDCPPVECTRPNEVWSGCPSECFSGYCSDREYQNVTCNTYVENCQPQCICRADTFRNSSEICVPASECDDGC